MRDTLVCVFHGAQRSNEIALDLHTFLGLDFELRQHPVLNKVQEFRYRKFERFYALADTPSVESVPPVPVGNPSEESGDGVVGRRP